MNVSSQFRNLRFLGQNLSLFVENGHTRTQKSIRTDPNQEELDRNKGEL